MTPEEFCEKYHDVCGEAKSLIEDKLPAVGQAFERLENSVVGGERQVANIVDPSGQSFELGLGIGATRAAFDTVKSVGQGIYWTGVNLGNFSQQNFATGLNVIGGRISAAAGSLRNDVSAISQYVSSGGSIPELLSTSAQNFSADFSRSWAEVSPLLPKNPREVGEVAGYVGGPVAFGEVLGAARLGAASEEIELLNASEEGQGLSLAGDALETPVETAEAPLSAESSGSDLAEEAMNSAKQAEGFSAECPGPTGSCGEGTTPSQSAESSPAALSEDTPTWGSEAGLWESDGKSPLEHYMEKVESLDVSTNPNEAVFYSGKGNRNLAQSFAETNGKRTLEMTPGGEWLDKEALFRGDSPLTPDDARKVWARLSQRYAEGVSGTVVGFVDGARPGSIFETVEWPELLKGKDGGRIANVITGGH